MAGRDVLAVLPTGGGKSAIYELAGMTRSGPTVVVYPEGIWYGGVTPADVPELFDAHLSGQRPVARLLLPPDVSVW